MYGVAHPCDALPPLVAADMDGTFLATSKAVPARNMALLHALVAAGAEFVPCTGRPVSAVPQEILAHPATRHAIGANGAVVYDVKADAPLHVRAMDKQLVLALYEAVQGLETTFDVFADGEVFAERWRYEAMGSYGIDAPSLAVLRRVRRPVDLSVEQILDRVGLVEKITCFWHHEEDCDALQRAVESLGCFSSAHGHPKNFELQAQGVSKGSALAWLCAHEGIEVAHTVAFGDEANDIPMLQVAGTGVAMLNATPEVKAAANCLTCSNDEAGVAAFFGIA